MANQRITYEQLLAYADGALRGGEAKDVADFIARDREAARTVERYRLAKLRFAGDDSAPPSAAAIARAQAIFKAAAPAARASWLEAVDRLVARLIYDSRLQPMAVRYADTGDRIDLTYATDDAEIDLQAARIAGDDDTRWQLMGQVTPSAGGALNFAIALASAGTTDPVFETKSDQHGTFALDVISGTYDVYIRRGDVADEGVVVIPSVRLE